MEKVKEFMDIYSQEIIRELGKREFNTTDVVSTIIQRKEWQKEYIELSERYGSYNKLNAQIGRYLLSNQKKLKICKNGGKEESIAITKRLSPNQKWKVMLVPILLLFMNISTYAQTLIPQENSKSKWGYVNETGKVVIKYKYDEAREFSESLAAVSIKDKSGNSKSGFIDKNGKVIIPLIYDEIGDFSEGLARVKKVTKLGYIDNTGKEVIPVIYDGIDEFSEGLARVKREGKIGFIDKTGKEIIPVKYDATDLLFIEGILLVKSGGKLGFIDKTGKEIIPLKYDEIGNFSEEGLAKVQNGGYWGFIDKTGKEVIAVKYEEIGEFSEGLAKVSKYDGSWTRWGFIDKAGKEIIPLEYFGASNFSNGYAVVKYATNRLGFNVNRDAIWGAIDKTGKEVLPGEYLKEEILKMIFDGTLQEKLQKHQEDKEKEEMLVEEVEAALDNDYYSANCHSVETLEKLLKQLEELEKSIPDGFDNLEKKSYLLKLQTGLLNAITTQRMTKKYGVTTAKKIMAGKYEIGMSKAIVKEIIGANIFYYKESITTMAGKKTEIWEFDYDAEGLRWFTWEVKNILKAKCPTFVFRDGKLTDIIR